MQPAHDFLQQALNATHTYGEPETIDTFRDRDGADYSNATPGSQTVAIRTRIRRRVTTTYPDGTVAEGWETLSESTRPLPQPEDETMPTTIYVKIDADSLGGADVEEYAAYVRAELARHYPGARITIATTTRESGVMPLVVEPYEATESVSYALRQCWDDYCGLEEHLDT